MLRAVRYALRAGVAAGRVRVGAPSSQWPSSSVLVVWLGRALEGFWLPGSRTYVLPVPSSLPVRRWSTGWAGRLCSISSKTKSPHLLGHHCCRERPLAGASTADKSPWGPWGITGLGLWREPGLGLALWCGFGLGFEPGLWPALSLGLEFGVEPGLGLALWPGLGLGLELGLVARCWSAGLAGTL